MRLISEDDVMEMLTNIELSCTPIPMIEAKTRLRDISTAYDVDKVVEKLEEIREEILTDTAYDNDTVNHYLGYADLMIEDVKAGGVNE